MIGDIKSRSRHCDKNGFCRETIRDTMIVRLSELRKTILNPEY